MSLQYHAEGHTMAMEAGGVEGGNMTWHNGELKAWEAANIHLISAAWH